MLRCSSKTRGETASVLLDAKLQAPPRLREVTAIFWVDLFANFAFTFDNAEGDEVVDLSRIAKHYLRHSFAINAVACIPEELVQYIVGGLSGSPWGVHAE